MQNKLNINDKQIESVDCTSKVLIIGNSQVGKTCLLLQYVYKKFNLTSTPTIGVDFQRKIVYAKNKVKMRMQLWDAAGQERFKSIVDGFYKGAQGAIVVFDVTDLQSLNSAAEWILQIENNCMTDIPVLLVGNKCDLLENPEIKLQYEEEFKPIIGNISQEYKTDYFECSAKTGFNLDKIFAILANKIVDKYDYKHFSESDDPDGDADISSGQNGSSSNYITSQNLSNGSKLRNTYTTQNDSQDTTKPYIKNKKKSGCC